MALDLHVALPATMGVIDTEEQLSKLREMEGQVGPDTTIAIETDPDPTAISAVTLQLAQSAITSFSSRGATVRLCDGLAAHLGRAETENR